MGIKKGILVLDAPVGSAAQLAGIRGTTGGGGGFFGGGGYYESVTLGDVIVGMDADDISTEADLFRAIEKHKIGDTVTVRVLRPISKESFSAVATVGASKSKAQSSSTGGGGSKMQQLRQGSSINDDDQDELNPAFSQAEIVNIKVKLQDPSSTMI